MLSQQERRWGGVRLPCKDLCLPLPCMTVAGQSGQSEGLTKVCLHMLEGERPAPAAEEGSPPRTEFTATTASPLQQPRGDTAASLTEGPAAGAGWSLRGPTGPVTAASTPLAG